MGPKRIGGSIPVFIVLYFSIFPFTGEVPVGRIAFLCSGSFCK